VGLAWAFGLAVAVGALGFLGSARLFTKRPAASVADAVGEAA
jgi:hypothetical protein